MPITDQVSDLRAAAGDPSGSLRASQADLTDINQSAMGNSPQPSMSIKHKGSWEGYRKTAPAHLTVPGTGYSNPNYSRKLRHAVPNAPVGAILKTTMPKMVNINNLTSHAVREGGTASKILKGIRSLGRF